MDMFTNGQTIQSENKYSLVGLVLPKMEELISLPFVGLFKIRWLFQDRMST